LSASQKYPDRDQVDLEGADILQTVRPQSCGGEKSKSQPLQELLSEELDFENPPSSQTEAFCCDSSLNYRASDFVQSKTDSTLPHSALARLLQP
jgi:hypothetical protein